MAKPIKPKQFLESEMLEETGSVIAVEDDSLWVETETRSSCSHCASAGSGCGTETVGRLFSAKRNRLRLDNALGARVGDRVVVGIPDVLLVRASLLAYLLPLLVMLAGAGLGAALRVSDAFQVLLALAGLALGFLLVHLGTRRLRSQRRFRPQLLRFAVTEGFRVGVPDISRS